MFDKQLVKGTFPLLVLAAVARDDMYGYQLIKFIDQTSGGVLGFSEGALYPVLHTLERDELLTAYWSEAKSGRKRKYYRITDAGRAELGARAADWAVFAQAVGLVLEPEADHHA